MNNEYAVRVEHAVVRFNMASERIDNLKEYFVKLVRRELMFKEFFALKDVSFEVKRRGLGHHRYKRIRKINVTEADLWDLKTI